MTANQVNIVKATIHPEMLLSLQSNEELTAAKSELEQNARHLDFRLHELLAKNQEMENISRLLAHDLREPMRKVRLSADIVRENAGALLDSEGSEGLSKIFSESDRALFLINEIQRFLEAGNQHEPITRVDLNEVIERAAQWVRQTSPDWTLEVSGLSTIQGRARQLQNLLEELFGNAAKFRSTERPLRVSVHGQKIQQNSYHATKDRYVYRDFLQVEISDNGCGFDAQYHSYVFELFKKVQLDSSGLGLGLSICRKIIAAHYGTIEFAPVSYPGEVTPGFAAS